MKGPSKANKESLKVASICLVNKTDQIIIPLFHYKTGMLQEGKQNTQVIDKILELTSVHSLNTLNSMNMCSI